MTESNKRQMGDGGPELTPRGFGSWAAGGPSKFGWAATDDDESIQALRFAIESGINWVDTAAFYGGVAWVLSLEEVTGAIAGARNTDQVRGWLPAGDLELGDDVRAEIDRLIALFEHSLAGIDPEEL